MIRFAAPWVLLGLPAVALFVWVLLRKQRRQLTLRLLAVMAILIALAEPEIVVREAKNATVFLVDRSASVRRTVQDAVLQRQIEDIMAAHPDWEYGVVAFAGRARVSTPLGEAFAGLPTTLGDSVGSRLDEAVDLGLAMLPLDRSSRLVLLSDGLLQGSEADAVAAAQRAGVPLSVLPVGGLSTNDARVASLQAPTETSVGQRFQLSASVAAEEPGPASVAVYEDDRLALYAATDLSLGSNALSFTTQLAQPGAVEFTAVVKREDDLFPENDTRAVLVQTTDRPRVLLFDPRSTSAVPRLLDALGIPYDAVTKLPSLTSLTHYDQLILAGVPLDDLTASEATAIELYVSNLGGGLLVIQGQSEVQGLSTSPIDALLPVSFSVPQTERDPSLAIVYVLDRSSSMSELVDARAKIRILREATAASVFLLPPDTLAGVIGFDVTHSWLYPLQRVGDAEGLYVMLQQLHAGGGTDLFYPVQEAVASLAETTARVKHVIIVSDGKTVPEERDYVGLLADIASYPDITVSAIALGEEPNLPLLGALAEAGRGQVYHVVDFRVLPQVIVDITQRLGRSRFVTGEVAVTGPLLDNVSGETPPLGGYVLTYSRESASVLLRAGDDPVAANWRKGLGSVSVLNCDLSGAWSERWLEWSNLSTLFVRLLATTEPRVSATTGLLPTVSLDSVEATLLVEARTATGGFADFLELEAMLLPEDVALDLRQVAPGVYRARFATPQAGGHAVVVSDPTSGRTARLSFSVPYAAEYAATRRDDDALRRIAEATGGAFLPEGSLDLAVRRVTAAAGRPLHSAFAILALVLFVADVALRKSRFRRLTLSRLDETARWPRVAERETPTAH